MKVQTQSVNFKADSDLLKYVEDKMNKLEKFHDKIIESDVFLKVQQTSERENKITEIKISIPNNSLIVKKEAKTFEEGVSLCIDSLKRQLTKAKEKIK